MTLNFQKHAAAIQSAYDRVVSSESNEEWVIFDYDGISNVLKVGDEGDYGIEEFATSFNSGRLQYGVIGVRPERNALTKIVLVHWQGEGVPSARVAATTSHIDAVRRYLKKVHVTIYARSEMDVEPDVIRREVAKLPSTFSSPTQYQGANNVDQHKPVQESLLKSPNKLNSHRKEIFEQKETAAHPHSIAVSHHNEKEKSSVPTASSLSPQQTQIYSCNSAASRSESGYETASTPTSATQEGPRVSCNQTSSPGSAGNSRAATADEIPQHNEQPLTLVGGLKARALWDYQAADGTEISFEPDDIITEIDQVDPGWWRGRGPSGDFGLFPANYVTLL
uniref:Drebrin-like protein n=1 Tax=Haemonchus contortus TaxID=6289 RepID=A0A7I4YEB7_HAECO